MSDTVEVVVYSFSAGIAVFLGALLSRFAERYGASPIREEFNHGAVAFGGGVLIAAVAFVLAPDAIETLAMAPLVLLFLAGAFAFFLADRFIERKGGFLGQLMALVMDFVPEAIALGATFGFDRRAGLLLAVFIGLQNLPEAFNAYVDLRRSGLSANRCLLVLFPLSFVGIAAALLGDRLLSDSPSLVASLMAFAAGGILYLMFDDIAPLVKMRAHWAPALGAPFGFLVGMIGAKLLG